LNETDVALSQVVSQMTTPNLLTVAEDMMQTRRMTIEDLIEANEVMISFDVFVCVYIYIYYFS